MPRLLRATFAALLLLALAVPAAGAEEGDALPPCTDAETEEPAFPDAEEAWIHQAETKVGNLAALGAGSFPSWDGTAPTGSVQGGAGGGYLTNSANFVANEPEAQDVVGLVMEGESAGCLDTLLIDLYAFLPTNRTGTSGSLAESPFIGIVTIEADGKPLLFGIEVEFKTTLNAAGTQSYRLRAAVNNLHARIVKAGIDPEGVRTLRITVEPRFVNTNNALFVYDTVEVPAGLIFNGEADDTYTPVKA